MREDMAASGPSSGLEQSGDRVHGHQCLRRYLNEELDGSPADARHDSEALLDGETPHDVVLGSRETYLTDVRRVWIQGSEHSNQAGREVLVEQ